MYVSESEPNAKHPKTHTHTGDKSTIHTGDRVEKDDKKNSTSIVFDVDVDVDAKPKIPSDMMSERVDKEQNTVSVTDNDMHTPTKTSVHIHTHANENTIPEPQQATAIIGIDQKAQHEEDHKGLRMRIMKGIGSGAKHNIGIEHAHDRTLTVLSSTSELLQRCAAVMALATTSSSSSASSSTTVPRADVAPSTSIPSISLSHPHLQLLKDVMEHLRTLSAALCERDSDLSKLRNATERMLRKVFEVETEKENAKTDEA